MNSKKLYTAVKRKSLDFDNQLSRMFCQISQVMTPANNIIGVSLLTMPFCFKQCGIVLAILMLILCNILSRLACHFLIKSAVISNKRKFVALASYAFGRMGKFLAKLLIIGFMLGTCVAYFVVIGDLESQLISKMIDKTPEEIRTNLLIITGVFVVLPLGLLRDIYYFNINISIVIFYFCFVLKIIVDSIFVGDWLDDINYWRSAGISQCLPILLMALFYQTQLLKIYETVPTIYVERVNNVGGALNVCTFIYICVGLFGYIGFHNSQPLTGNILLSLKPDIVSEMIKLGFILFIALNFPLVIFPCRESLNSLLVYRVTHYELFTSHLPISKFRCLISLISIVIISLIISILMPSIEFVLSVMGSTIGVTICLIFPAAIFVSITDRNTCQKLLAQCVVIFGILLMVFGMYANLHPIEESTNAKSTNILQISRPLNVTEDLHTSLNVTHSLTRNPDAKNKMNNMQKNNIFNKAVLTTKDDIQSVLFMPKLMIDIKKRSVEKSDKTTINTVIPIKDIKVKTIETLNENLNAMQIIENIESYTINKSFTLKTEEKKRFVDLQKNDTSLINLNVIGKEKSNFTNNEDVANVGTAKWYKQFRILLKNNLKLHQIAKKNLEEIEAQKQELERERQRMAKNEMFKKRENEINGIILLENKTDLGGKLKKYDREVEKNERHKNMKENRKIMKEIEEAKYDIMKIKKELESIKTDMKEIQKKV